MANNIEVLARFIARSKHIVVFTGAGISTESGISDYRSKGGIYDRFKPITYQEFVSSKDKRKEQWQRKMELFESFKDVSPNDGHAAIFQLEKMGKLDGIVTQNIDGLHQLAGNDSAKVLEIHGTNRTTICLSCSDIKPWEHVYERLKAGDASPLCEKCKGILKSNTISFGQNLNQQVLKSSMARAADCDLMLAIGSTLVVEPAASIPRVAKQYGAPLVIINLSETPLDALADLKIEAGAGEVLQSALELVGEY